MRVIVCSSIKLRDFAVDDRVAFTLTSADGRRALDTITKQPAPPK